MAVHVSQVGTYAFEAKTDKWSVRVDLGLDHGGDGSGPTPSQLLAISLLACKLVTAQVWAKKRGIELSGLEGDVGYEMAENPTRIGVFSVEVRNLLGQVPAELRERVERALHACWVAQTLAHPPRVEVKVG